MVHLETAGDKLLSGEDPILVGVQPVEGHLHIFSQMPGTHLHAGVGRHPGHGRDIYAD